MSRLAFSLRGIIAKRRSHRRVGCRSGRRRPERDKGCVSQPASTTRTRTTSYTPPRHVPESPQVLKRVHADPPSGSALATTSSTSRQPRPRSPRRPLLWMGGGQARVGRRGHRQHRCGGRGRRRKEPPGLDEPSLLCVFSCGGPELRSFAMQGEQPRQRADGGGDPTGLESRCWVRPTRRSRVRLDI